MSRPNPTQLSEERIPSGASSMAQTLARGLAVLETFTVDFPSLGNAGIALRIGLSRPTVARLTKTLAELGYLAYDARAAKYRLRGGVLKAAYPLLAGMKIRQTARPLMQEFANGVRGAVSLGIMDGLDMIYVETARCSEGSHHTPDIGSSIPLPRSAMGRALWSMLKPTQSERLRERFRSEAAEVWERFGSRVDEGRRECAERGFCISRGDWVPEIHAVASPLFVEAGSEVAFAINCGIPAFRLAAGQLENEVGPRLAALARSIRALSGRA